MHSVTLRRRAPSQASSLHAIEIPAPSPALQAVTQPVSIYQRCLQTMDRLAKVPGFTPFLEAGCRSKGSAPADSANSSLDGTVTGETSTMDESNAEAAAKVDPIQYLSTIFRDGLSLITIFNALRPNEPVPIDLQRMNSLKREKQEQLKIFAFLKGFTASGLDKQAPTITVSDPFREDTNSFIKVLDVVTVMLNELEKEGKLDESVTYRPSLRFSEATAKRPENNRERVVAEILETERSYVNDLETLQRYMNEVQLQHLLPEETIRLMFANLNSLLDFQRRFLVRVEVESRKPDDEQQFGALFLSMEEGFSVYEPYIANHDRAADIALREAPALTKLSHIINPVFQLPSLLIKPVQRICKYELLYRELIKFSDKDAPNQADMQEGYEAAKRVANRSNETMRREENYNALKELEMRVEEWRRADFSKYGELHLFDKFHMTTSALVNELLLYLFDDSLICCKEILPPKENRKSQKHQSSGSGGATDTPLADPVAEIRRKKGTLQVKGRVHLYKIQRIVNNSTEGSLSLTFFWKDMVMEQFALKFRTEEQLTKWKATIEQLSKKAREKDERQRQGAAAVSAAPPVPARQEANVPEHVMLHPNIGYLSHAVPATPTTPSTPGFFMGGQFSNNGTPGYPYPGTPGGGPPPPPKLTHVHSHNYLAPTGSSPVPSSHLAGAHQLGAHPPPQGSSLRKVSGMVENGGYLNGYSTHHPSSEESQPPETYYYYRRGGSTSEVGELGNLPENFQRGVRISREPSLDIHAALPRSASAMGSHARPAGDGLYRPGHPGAAPYHPQASHSNLPVGPRTSGAAGGSLGSGAIPFRDRSGSTPNIFAPYGDRPPHRVSPSLPPHPHPPNQYMPALPKLNPLPVERYYSENPAHYEEASLRNAAPLPRPPGISTQGYNGQTHLTQLSASAQVSPVDGKSPGYPPLAVVHPTPSAQHHLYPHRRSPSNSISQGSAPDARAASGSPSAQRNLSPLSHGLQNSFPFPPELAAMTSSMAAGSAAPMVKVKVNYRSEIFALMVPVDISYIELTSRVERKINVCTGRKSGGIEATAAAAAVANGGANSSSTARPADAPPLVFKYQDEDGDYVSMDNDQDFQIALETRQKSPMLPGPGSGPMANASPHQDPKSQDPFSNAGSGVWSINIFVS
ncbi:Guanine nucleotide exchange factor for Cdc42p [Tieghemiomyces parasiticus]|uniref:Guanine nucleotide exchange factor for Cdc42p n=1 Tax=Tieghemiomyces parasiticus TaxID=78921 RepID=A0A9W8ADW6_9FUNG|nr:Guanine nucleotide exchange factor for Cdc42p [Tieghemiomyces parasiticus]